MIVIQRPRKIQHGLQMTLEIHLNHTKSRNIDCAKWLIHLYQHGKLKEILKTSCDLEMAAKGGVTMKVNSNIIDKFPENIGLIWELPRVIQ